MLLQLGSITRSTAEVGEEKRDAAEERTLDTGSFSLLGRKAGTEEEEKSSSHSKPPPIGKTLRQDIGKNIQLLCTSRGFFPFTFFVG